MNNYRTLLGKVRRRILRQLGRAKTGAPPYTMPPGHTVQPREGLYLVLDHPPTPTVEIQAGVLSLRGWAWSREGGAGTLFLEIQNGQAQHQLDLPIEAPEDNAYDRRLHALISLELWLRRFVDSGN